MFTDLPCNLDNIANGEFWVEMSGHPEPDFTLVMWQCGQHLLRMLSASTRTSIQDRDKNLILKHFIMVSLHYIDKNRHKYVLQIMFPTFHFPTEIDL